VKEDIIHTLATQNSDWLSRIIRENNFNLNELTTIDEVERFLEEIIISKDIKEFFDKHSIEAPSKVIVFFPHNPYPSRTGAHRRCLEMLSALKELGCEVLLFSSNLFTDQAWTQSSINYLNAHLGIKTYLHQADIQDYNYLQEQQKLTQVDKTNWDYFTPPLMLQNFQEVCHGFCPNLILINYSLWGNLVSSPEYTGVLRILETHDLFTLNIKMSQYLKSYISKNSDNSNTYLLDSCVLEEDFFNDRGLNTEPEEYQMCDLFHHTIAISKAESELLRANTQKTEITHIPITIESQFLENRYDSNPVFVASGNIYNFQGCNYFTRRVLPLIHDVFPDFRLNVVGEICTQITSEPGLEIQGYIDNLSSIYASASFAICPLIGGTGQQVKIVEAMSYGLPVIALKNVAHTSPLEHGIDGFIAENATEFAEYCKQLFADRTLCRKMGQSARLKIESQFSQKSILNLLKPIVEQSKKFAYKRPSHRIVIDAVFFQFYQTGIARVWISLLNEWIKTGLAKHILVLDRRGTAPKIPGIRYRGLPLYDSANPEQERAFLQQVCDEEQADIFISSYYTIPETTPSVFMAYDMIPEVLGNMEIIMMKEKHDAIRHASAYVSISENTAKDLRELFPEASAKPLTIAHCGISHELVTATTGEISSFKYKYGIRRPYFLLVGSGFTQVNNYKNGSLFFEAFVQLENHESFDIVCTGGINFDPQFRQYTGGSTVHMLRLPDDELRLAYAGAVALVFPSRYEGFGMPVAEAMACGCPVITCSNSSIPEVAGEAALYVNEFDIAQMAKALGEVQKLDVRDKLIQAGLYQAKKFNWSTMAQQVQKALIEATLIHLNLREINYIVCPDWSQPEELLAAELEHVLEMVANSSEKEKITLLISLEGGDAETADLIVSSAAMNLLMTSDLDISEDLAISLVGDLSNMQWQVLVPMLQNRFQLEHENGRLIQTQLSQVPIL
jgi:glycosyltransferase involved in cell wall biosynthesis